MAKIAQGADPGDHFRTTDIKHGYEGRGWAQRSALRKTSPLLVKNYQYILNVPLTYFQLSKVLSASKRIQQLIFGSIATTTEIQFNATYTGDIGHIHIGSCQIRQTSFTYQFFRRTNV